MPGSASLRPPLGDALHNRIASLEKNVEVAVSSTLEHLLDFERQTRLEQGQSNAQILAAVNSTKVFLTLNQLRDIVGVDSQLVNLDLEVAMLDAEQDASPTMNEIPGASDQMGEHHNLQEEAASLLMLLSCLLYRRLSKSGTVLPLIHLCGQHNGPDDPFNRPSGMLRHISAHLLDAEPDRVDLSAFNLDTIQGIQGSNLQYLQHLFRTPLMAATGRVVVLIIDEISWLEETPWDDEFGVVAQFWRNLVSVFNRGIPGQTGPVLKVLIKNPTVSRYAEQWLPNDSCVLDLADEGYTDEISLGFESAVGVAY
ncbi:uncharacterized protein BCR38DRAFT_415215 [Pseudomassariella vexata]|uniref:Uncharacterized protein n=1 Tax=Pseudomassariella vexata TaxID=1141098 RepID=A0A1Y2D642_9PEZI|nr:uncharacterized protein BCR38DRAFT_415215 [Pseudomassariella vexata]ORY54720.1 hypothetical protein BCR38DRAFT_415215 [Pseudomassariella vexata]